jgi:hypothetical protein
MKNLVSFKRTKQNLPDERPTKIFKTREEPHLIFGL